MTTKRAVEEVGLLGYVTCKKSFPDSDISNIMIINDVGGSSFLPPGRYKVRVTHGFDDYETGRRLHGELVDEKDVKIATKAGTTGYAKKAKRERTGLELVDPDQRKFNPKKVYFSGRDFEPERTTKEFKVAAVSSNLNAFCLRGIIIIAQDGEAWQVAVNDLNEKKKGDLVRFPVVGEKTKPEPTAAWFFEVPERLTDAPPGVVKEVWKERRRR